jgi:hypothetical protein
MKRKNAAFVLTVALSTFFAGSQVCADDASARRVLKGMSDYLAGQKTFSLAFDSDIEVITADLQKIQFISSGQVLLSRPDKLRATRTGGYADLELVFDGKTLTLHGKNLNAYTQVEAAGAIDPLIDRLRDELGVSAPGADLLLSRVYDELTADVIDAKHIGTGVIDGVACEHLAFRNAETDWQIWVEIGARPVPRKYVITSKTVNGSPQYTLRLRDWRTDVETNADAFAFKPPQGAAQVGIAALPDIDEVPYGVVSAGRR